MSPHRSDLLLSHSVQQLKLLATFSQHLLLQSYVECKMSSCFCMDGGVRVSYTSNCDVTRCVHFDMLHFTSATWQQKHYSWPPLWKQQHTRKSCESQEKKIWELLNRHSVKGQHEGLFSDAFVTGVRVPLDNTYSTFSVFFFFFWIQEINMTLRCSTKCWHLGMPAKRKESECESIFLKRRSVWT